MHPNSLKNLTYRIPKGSVPWIKGKKHSKETIEKMKKRVVSTVTKVTKVTKLKISKSKKLNPIRYWLGKKREQMSGEKHPMWKGGVSCLDRKKYVSEYQKLWRDENREKVRYYNRMRHCLREKVGGTYSLLEWESLKRRFNNMCLCCKRFEPEIVLTVDHIIPLSLGGDNNIKNIQPLCKSCNSRKNAKNIDYISFYELSQKI